MAPHQPPPDWHFYPECDLERLYCGEDEELARGALVELRRRHDDILRRRASCGCGGNKDREEEAMQRLDARLWEKRKTYDPDKGRWIGWVRTILARIIVELFRERARFGDAPIARPADPGSPSRDWTDQIAGQGAPPDWQLKLQELQQAMADCLQRLSPEEREALILQVLEDLSLTEMATQTEAPPGTVGTRAFRARNKMRECLKRKGYEGGKP
jgi:RNA polymerase sigma factor (sigma-70 family)